MAEKKTSILMNDFKKVKNNKDLDAFIKNENLEDLSDIVLFKEYFFSLQSVKNMNLADIVKKSNLDEKYAHEMLSFKVKKKIGRDRALAIMIAGGLNVDEIQRGLEKAKLNTLYIKDSRDACIIFGIEQGYSVMKINDLLEEKGLMHLEGTYAK